MSKRYSEYCACGQLLVLSTEVAEGQCLTCIVHDTDRDTLTRMCADCGELMEDPSELIGGRCPKCADAERRLGGRIPSDNKECS